MLVIIGLLVGGVLVGTSMIRSAELQSIGADVNRFRAAANMFKMRYSATPGDMKNATDYWGTSSGGCPDGTGTGTCNGDGNGLITDGTGQEMHRFWQHLTLAGLINGNYTGVAGGGSPVAAVIGINCPASRVVGVGYSVRNVAYSAGSTPYLFPGDYSHIFMIGKVTPYESYGPFMVPADAAALDAKYDDGKPGTGQYVQRTNIAAGSGGFPGCTNGDTTQGNTATYLNDTTTLACGLHVLNAF